MIAFVDSWMTNNLERAACVTGKMVAKSPAIPSPVREPSLNMKVVMVKPVDNGKLQNQLSDRDTLTSALLKKNASGK